MHPVTHLLTGWTLAESARLGRRDRVLVTLAGCVPDLDGLGVFADLLTEHSRHPLYLYDTYHHVLLHNAATGLLLGLLALSLGRRRVAAGFCSFSSASTCTCSGISLGSRGPDGYQWPIPYLEPFSGAWQLAWSHQWGLKAWPNVTLTIGLLALTLYWSWRRGTIACRDPVHQGGRFPGQDAAGAFSGNPSGKAVGRRPEPPGVGSRRLPYQLSLFPNFTSFTTGARHGIRHRL